MLYVTTRNDRDTFTAQRVLREKRCVDGGMYLPFRAPQFSPAEIDALFEKPFGSCVAEILNLLFKSNMTGWDVDFGIGRYPVRLTPLGHRILMAECWHNPDWNYDRLLNNLSAQLLGGEEVPGGWTKIAVRIAVLFGIFGELRRSGINSADISVVSGDFSAPISAWYARQWGLPIGSIICCCNENNSFWELLCNGKLRTDILSISTSIPEADVAVPNHLERLIYSCGGVKEAERYLDACRKGGSYCPDDMVLNRMRDGLFVSVVSTRRAEKKISGIFRSHSYLMSPATALAYAGLQDYRSINGEPRYAVVLSDKSPLCEADVVAKSLGVSPQELQRMLQ